MRALILISGALALATCAASAATPVRVAFGAHASAATVGQPWTATLTVRPASFCGPLRVTAAGRGRVVARASRTARSYRIRLVFPAAGRWTLTARAGGSTSRLGSVTARRPPALRFVWPTSVDMAPDGSLLVVENGRGRVLLVHPRTGVARVVGSGLTKAFAAARAASGSIYVSDGPSLKRLAGGAPQTVATVDEDIGPLAVAPGGAVFYATATRLFRLAAAGGAPRMLTAGLSGPHGLAVAANGAVLVSDTAADRVLRIDPESGNATTLIRTTQPRGLDVAADGTIYVVEARTRRVGRYGADGTRLGDVGPVFGDPYAVASAPGGAVFVVDTSASGVIRRVARGGATATIPTG